MNFKDRVAVITGSARGIGHRIAEELAQRGARVVISDLDPDAVTRAAREIAAQAGVETLAQPADVQDPDQIRQLMAAAEARFGRIDMLVNNAGICPLTSIDDIGLEEWNRVMAVNLGGVFFCCQSVMPIMRRQERGKILNIASIAGKFGGLAAGAHYSATKAGVICLTKVFARQLGPQGINVNAIAPGPVETEMVKDFPPEIRKKLVDDNPLGRIAQTEDIAAGALFLLSDGARHITGEILDINGGMLMD